jgi:hypothetical protein
MFVKLQKVCSEKITWVKQFKLNRLKSIMRIVKQEAAWQFNELSNSDSIISTKILKSKLI